ncbi:MAG: Ig-like domain repeat protein [Acidobacteriaceae bacterium]
MAIESAAYFSRLARTGLVSFIGIASLCSVASAQKELVTTGSVIPLQHSTSYCQIYNVDIAPNGDALFLDVCGGGGYGAIYRLPVGSTTFSTITSSIDSAGTYWNEGMAMDALGNLYITDRYSGSNHIYRVPYDSASNSWTYSTSDSWEATIDGGFEGNGTQNAVFLNSAAKDGSGILFVSEQQANDIVMIPVNAGGTVPLFPSGVDAGQPEFQYLIKGLKDKVMPMAVDVNGNLYFIENPYDPPASRTTGVFFVPASAYTACMASSAAGTTAPTTPCISGAEGSLSRIDAGNTEKFNGLTLDAAGNVYVGDTSDSYGGTRNGLLEIPNESGSPIGVTASSFNFGDAEYLSPAPVNAYPTIDPRGFFWLPQGTANLWNPNGSTTGIPGTGNLILYQLGAANVGATPVGTPSATGTVFFTFSGSVTPASFVFSQPGGGTDFSAVSTNPYPPATGNAPTVPCAPSTQAKPSTYTAFTSCEYWVALTPQGTNSVGSVSGQLSMLDSSNKVISGSTTDLTGIGEGPAAALLIPANQTPLATGLVSPKQVAGDSLGNSYVADSGLGKVLMFAAGSTTASAGTSIGTGLTAPTGVAVDGFGDVYIGDSGKIIEVPAVNGTLNPAGQTTLLSGLGANLNLAVDGAGNVYAADPANARVVRTYNPQMSMALEPTVSGTTTIPNTIGTGFTKPTAVAVDDSGDVYVADGTNLHEITFWGNQITIPGNLSSPVTGLAVDPSGSVYVAQSGGVLRIPLETSGPNFNDAAQIDSAGVTSPSGIAIDSLGNLYVTAASYTVPTYTSSAAPTTTTISTPNLLSLSGAFVGFGTVSTQTQSNPVDVEVYNIGNEPLALAGNPTFSGTNAADYSIETDGQIPCDTTGTTPIPSATACSLGVTVTAANNYLSQAAMSVPTTAVNAPSTSAVLEAYALNNLCLTKTTITLTPATGLSYPANATVSATVAPVDPTCSTGNEPTGGNLVLTLGPQAKGSSQTTQTVVLKNGTASFNLTGLNGGTYLLFASYKGDTIFGGSSSSRTYSFVVAQATPTIILSNPIGIAPIYNTYYVLQGATATLEASVTSAVGSPSGSIEILNNGSAPADPKQNPITLGANGTATFNTSNLAVGTYNLTAVYAGDLNFANVTSSVVTIQVINPSALITASPASLTTPAGTPVTSALTITPLEGYNPQNGVQMYCEVQPVDTVPPDAECTFDVPLVKFSSTVGAPATPQITHVTISSNIPVNQSSIRTQTSPILFAGIFGLGLVGLGLRRRTKFNRAPLTLLCGLLLFTGTLFGFTGCTNSGYTTTPPAPHVTTPAGTYSVSIYTLDLGTNQISSLPFTLSVTITAAK